MNSQANPKAPAWTAADLQSPHNARDKAGRVRAMFAAIAPSYDLNNRLHSFGRDQAWRRRAVREALRPHTPPGTPPVPGGSARNDPNTSTDPTETVVIDVACGTGDLTEAFARAGATRIIGIDFTREMLDVAERKRDRVPPDARSRIEYRQGDAMALDLDDASADVISIAFGIRNVAEPARALAEFHRVLRPGGRLVILEFDQPRFAPIRWLNNLYCSTIMPRTATLLSRDRSGAYRYLPRSVRTFATREQLAAMVTQAGFTDLCQIPLTLGVCACTVARRG